jgi:hypothetical protein
MLSDVKRKNLRQSREIISHLPPLIAKLLKQLLSLLNALQPIVEIGDR